MYLTECSINGTGGTNRNWSDVKKITFQGSIKIELKSLFMCFRGDRGDPRLGQGGHVQAAQAVWPRPATGNIYLTLIAS